VTSWYHCVAEEFRIPKMPVINPLPALVHLQTQKKTILHGLSIPNPNFSKFAIFGKLIDLQMRNCGFQSSKQLMSKSAPKIRICCSISWF
jgi:hypothetical protein